jgi:hypothetical protein
MLASKQFKCVKDQLNNIKRPTMESQLSSCIKFSDPDLHVAAACVLHVAPISPSWKEVLSFMNFAKEIVL